MVAPVGFFDPHLALGTLFELTSFDKPQELVISYVVPRRLELPAGLSNVKGHHALETVVFLAQLALELSAPGFKYKSVVAVGRRTPTHVSLAADRVFEQVAFVRGKLLFLEYLSYVFVGHVLLALGVRTLEWESALCNLMSEVGRQALRVVKVLARLKE